MHSISKRIISSLREPFKIPYNKRFNRILSLFLLNHQYEITTPRSSKQTSHNLFQKEKIHKIKNQRKIPAKSRTSKRLKKKLGHPAGLKNQNKTICANIRDTKQKIAKILDKNTKQEQACVTTKEK